MDWLALTFLALVVASLAASAVCLLLDKLRLAEIFAVLSVLFVMCWGFAWVGSVLGANADQKAGKTPVSRRRNLIAGGLLAGYGLGLGVYRSTGSTAMAWTTVFFVAAITVIISWKHQPTPVQRGDVVSMKFGSAFVVSLVEAGGRFGYTLRIFDREYDRRPDSFVRDDIRDMSAKGGFERAQLSPMQFEETEPLVMGSLGRELPGTQITQATP